ncbi:MAG: prepilin-type N-terminal cleavage/methylation domain-containing protein [Lachnospiraceae bacterium]|jgi:prepilin-type N-terminal cleavage/methylation domain-containing protein|nr:prepilin-type N-terminal cleavage/methylation domain-containing protein [Lachnospiraceae bacterium]
MIKRKGLKKNINTKRRVEHSGVHCGFSLVEVLISLAILAIFGTSLYAGLRSSALLNSRAFYTQEATTHAQRAMESVRGLRFTDVTDPDAIEADLQALFGGGGIDAADIIVDTTLWSANDNEGVGAHTFTQMTYRLPGVQIASRTYEMRVTLDPLPYSVGAVEHDATGMAGIFIDDANIVELPRIEQIDGLRFPLIGTELQQPEQWVTFTDPADDDYAVLTALVGEARSHGLSSTREQIFNAMEKTIFVTISGDDDRIRVIADLVYEATVSGTTIRKAYNVYDSRFSLSFDENTGMWTRGGRIYLFATAFIDYRDALGNNFQRPHGNHIVIDHSGYDTLLGRMLELYLVRGFYTDTAGVIRGSEFDSIAFRLPSPGGTEYYYSDALAAVVTGEEEYGWLRFLTNVKGDLGATTIDVDHLGNTIGLDRARLANYEVTVDMVNENGDVVASIVSTMRIR